MSTPTLSRVLDRSSHSACSPLFVVGHSLQPQPQRTDRGTQSTAVIQASTAGTTLSSGHVHGRRVKLSEKRRAAILVQPLGGHDNSNTRDTRAVRPVEDRMTRVSHGPIGLFPPSLASNPTRSQPHVVRPPATSSSSIETVAVIPLLFLHEGTTMPIPIQEIPNPPVFRIQQGMEGILDLNARWDDHPGHWGGHSHLVIMGRPIPQYYWRLIYRHRFPEQWSKIKSQWDRCQVRPSTPNPSIFSPLAQAVVNRFRLGTEEEFRTTFCDNHGGRRSIEDICVHIREEKAEGRQDGCCPSHRGARRGHHQYGKGSGFLCVHNAKSKGDCPQGEGPRFCSTSSSPSPCDPLPRRA